MKLEDKFILPKPNKTLRLQPKVAQQLGPLVEYAQEFLWNQQEYNRIEFKYDRTWIVVAKLKDEEWDGTQI